MSSNLEETAMTLGFDRGTLRYERSPLCASQTLRSNLALALLQEYAEMWMYHPPPGPPDVPEPILEACGVRKKLAHAVLKDTALNQLVEDSDDEDETDKNNNKKKKKPKSTVKLLAKKKEKDPRLAWEGASIAMGWAHTLILTKDQEVYSYGRVANGRLGLGGDPEGKLAPMPCRLGAEKRRAKIICKPTQVHDLSGKGVIQVSAGYRHSLTVTQDGDIYAFGFGQFGALGTGNEKSTSTPKMIQLIDPKSVPKPVQSQREKKKAQEPTHPGLMKAASTSTSTSTSSGNDEEEQAVGTEEEELRYNLQRASFRAGGGGAIALARGLVQKLKMAQVSAGRSVV
jgi:hypothetical protein